MMKEDMYMEDELKYAMTMPTTQCVVRDGLTVMLQLFADIVDSTIPSIVSVTYKWKIIKEGRDRDITVDI